MVTGSRHLYLVRHGRVVTPGPVGPMDAGTFERWRVRVDGVGLDPHDTPPRSVTDVAEGASVIVSSDLARAIESARVVARGRTIQATPLLREIPLPVPRAFSMKLPPAMWEALAHARWGLNIMRRTDASAADIQRAADCADWLEDRSRVEPSILAITHGVFRRLLARTLCHRGWDLRGQRRYAHWSLWKLTRGPQPRQPRHLGAPRGGW